MYSFKRMMSLVLSICMMLSLLNGLTIPKAAAASTSGIDENGFSYTSDGTGVTITGYDVTMAGAQFFGIEYNGHYYGLSSGVKTWSEAKTHCEVSGGHLVTISSAEEQELVQRVLSYANTATAWIGATDETTEGEWGWCTGEAFTYTNWDSGEPNDQDGEDYAGIYNDDFKWNDWNSSHVLNYICEWEEAPPEGVFSIHKFYGIENNGHYYGLSQDMRSWEEAKTSCENAGGQLVCINTEDEQAVVERLLSMTSSGNRWIGAYKADGLWQWVDGEVLGYSNWNPGEPSGNADTAYIYYNNHKWDDAPGTLYYICEWTEKPAEDVFVISLVDIEIPSEIDGVPVTAIANSAFQNNKFIRSVVIPEGVTSIGSYAFQNCKNLTEISLADTITTIQYRAFQGCSALNAITLPANITTLGERVFSGCTGIQEITIPASLTAAAYAFADSSIVQATLEEGMETTPYRLFHSCATLTTATLPSTLKSTEPDLFLDCTSLKEAELPEGLKTLGNYAFCGCTALESITLPAGLESIGTYAFNGCTNLKDIDLNGENGAVKLLEHEGHYYAVFNRTCYWDKANELCQSYGGHLLTITSQEEQDFVQTLLERSGRDTYWLGATDLENEGTWQWITGESFEYQNWKSGQPDNYRTENYLQIYKSDYTWNDNNATSGNLSDTVGFICEWEEYPDIDAAELIDPEQADSIENTVLESIGERAFSRCTALNEISLPETVRTIGYRAFNGCTGLTSMELPADITTMGGYVFDGCTGITQITIPASLTTAESTFANSSIETVRFEEGLTTTPYGLLRDNKALKSVTLPTSLVSISNDLFLGCTLLEEVIIPENVTTLGDHVFDSCTALKKVTLPEGLQTIGGYAFYKCTGLTEIDLPDTVTQIGNRAFQGCTGLTSMELPANITTMGDNVFNGCTGITEITLPASLTTAESTFANSSIETVHFEEGLTTTPYRLLRDNKALKSVTLPTSLISISNDLFLGCTSLEEVIIPENVTTLGGYVFNSCTALKKVTLPEGLQTIGEYAFANCTGLTEIDLPDTVTEIRNRAFQGCTGLTSMELPANITTMGNRVFSGCTGIQEITIPASLTTAECTFADSSIVHATLEEGMEATPYRLFHSCATLTTVTLPSTLKTTGADLFLDCTSLKEVELPETLKTLGNYAFCGCTSLEIIKLPRGLESIGTYAFNGCTNLKDIDLNGENGAVKLLEHEGHYYAVFNRTCYWDKANELCQSYGGHLLTITSQEEQDFVQTLLERSGRDTYWLGATDLENEGTWQWITGESFEYQNWKSGQPDNYRTENYLQIYKSDYTWNDNNATSGNLSDTIGFICEWEDEPQIASAEIIALDRTNDIENSVLETIGNYAFKGCTSLTDLDIPDSVRTIGSYAFQGCTGIKEITLPASLTTADCAFTNSSIETVYFAEGAATVPYRIFYNCASLKNVEFSDTLTSVASHAFYGCTSLTSMPLPDSVTSIGEYAFFNCTGLTDISVTEGIDRIWRYTYGNCTGLTSIEIPSHIKAIYHDAFNGCSNLTDVTFNEGLEVIGYAAFNGTSIEEVVIPKSVWMLSFSNYSNADETTANHATANYASAFYGSKLKKVTFAEGADAIGLYSFYNCTSLSEVIIPDSVTAIKDSAFRNCTGLTHIEIPASVTSIGNYAFNGCSGLANATFELQNEIEVLEYNDHYYAVFSDRKTWEAAKQICEAFGGHLVTITDAEENAFVKMLANKQKTTCRIGGSDFDTEGTWQWVTNETWNYTNWDGAQPDNDNNQDYATIRINGKWDDDYNTTAFPFICEWDSLDAFGAFVPQVVTQEEYTVNSLPSVGTNAFASTALTDVYYTGTQEQWNVISISTGNDPLINATFHFGHTHIFGEWEVDREPTCAETGRKHKACTDCGYAVYESIETVPHTYEATVVPPTYVEQGYTLFTCTVCGATYQDVFVDPVERTELSQATLTLEYTSAFYEGAALTPGVLLTYGGESFDPAQELKLTYVNNDQAGTATVIAEGIYRFKGTVELTFEISYEVVPERIVNVLAIGEIGKVSLSWGESSEVNTDRYRIYRKAADETEYQLIKTINGRMVLTYEDRSVEKGKIYSYYVTGVGLYGAESEPSLVVMAEVLMDQTAPVVLKLVPAAASVISGKTTLSATATDNVGVTRVAYFYTLDNGETWLSIGEATNRSFSLTFDTAGLGTQSVKVKAMAYDAEGNVSEPLMAVYSLDNVGPEKVTGLSAVTLSSKITLSWADVSANDASHFILQTKSGDDWKTVNSKVMTLGYTITGLQPDTDYLYRVACVDTHGNVGEYSDEFTARTAADVTAPVITSQSPNAARYSSTIKFSATAKDDCDIAQLQIQVSTDRSSWTTINTDTYTARVYTQTSTYTIDLSGYPEGSIFVRAVATDFSGNVSDTGDTAAYTEYVVDRTGPAAPENVAARGYDGYITVSWSVGSESDLGKYFVYKSTTADGNFQLIASNLSSLNYHDRDVQSGREFFYRVAVSDTCGNMSLDSQTVSATMTRDTKAPEITSISTTYQQKISPTSHTINVAATDNNQLSQLVVEYRIGGDSEFTQLVKEENINDHYRSIPVTLPIDGLTDGAVIEVRAYAVDAADFRSGYATARYTLDTTAPQFRDHTAEVDGSTVSLSWSDYGESDLAGFKVYRSADGVSFTLLGARGVNSSSTYRFVDNITAKESGTYTYKLEAIDRLGNTASQTQTVEYTYVYVNQPPVARMSIPDLMTVGVEESFRASDSNDDITIEAYAWDFGDGTTSTEMNPVKRYDAIGTYTVQLTVTDNEGLTATVTRQIEVKDREILGTLNVKVLDETGKALSYVPVYFDLGSDYQKIIYTNAAGVATLQMISGTHTIGMYASGYLPVKKDTVVLANAVRNVTLTTVQEDIVTGKFEVTRMTFDEIVAAGIDVYDPANQNVYSAVVRVTYGSAPPFIINYVRNDDRIIGYTVCDSSGNPLDQHPNNGGGAIAQYTNSNGERRQITGITYIPNKSGSDVVAIVDIPAEASYLKEFFDVKLHIVNNASSEFVLEMNEVVLNVPEGMTLMTTVGGSYSTSETVKIDSIRGQETVTLSWVLRGDLAGEYDLSADFTGTLAEFNELVTARFETDEPIKVYGLEGVKFRILAADEIHNDTLYFKVELENQRDIDIYMPAIGVTDKIKNVTESVLNNNPAGDFSTDAHILNAYIETENGVKQYVPVTYEVNGRAYTDVEVLPPGQKIVYEYVAYNAINYVGVAYFRDAAILEFEGILDNIEVGSYHKERYSFTDYSAKLDSVLQDSNAAVTEAFDYINTNENYYYVNEAEDELTNVCQQLYSLTDLVLSADISHFTQEDKRDLIEQIILSILADSSTVEMAEDLQAEKYLGSVKNLIDQTKNGLLKKSVSGDVEGLCNELLGDSKDLACTYMEKGPEAFYDELYTKLGEKAASYAVALALDGQVEEFFEDIGISETEAFSSTLIKPTTFANGVLDALEKTQRQEYIAAVLKMECNAEYSHYILDTIIRNANGSGMTSLIIDVAQDLDKRIDASQQECYDYVGQFCANLGTEIGEMALEHVIEAAISATPLSLASKIFTPINLIFNFDSFYKQQDTLDVYNAMSRCMLAAFEDTSSVRSEEADFYSMAMLKAACELRLSGEAEFKSFMNDYMAGKYALPLSEETVLREINGVKNTSYTTIDEWWDDVQYNIVRSRDILFSTEGLSQLDTPRAPVVSLDYETLQTRQSFASEYEYCFSDGVWIRCENAPISFTLKQTPSVLRVRKAAGDTNLAGSITTVRIFARKELSKLISVRFDGTGYLINDLAEGYAYQVVFTDDPDAAVDWSKSRTIGGSNDTIRINSVKEYDYMMIRGLDNQDKLVTFPEAKCLTVIKKLPLPLVIDGCGSVTQMEPTGCYFPGESADLMAAAYPGNSFLGWFVDGVLVSADPHYVVEVSESVSITAKFTGAKLTGIRLEALPDQLECFLDEAVNLTGLKVTGVYDDGTTRELEHYSAYLTAAATAGKGMVTISYGGHTAGFEVGLKFREGNLIWTLDAAAGVLTISGEGRTRSYEEGIGASWCEYSEYIHSAVIGEGVSGIGAHAFAGCSQMHGVTFLGDAPAFDAECFSSVTAVMSYPTDNGTWNCSVIHDYGGSLTWPGLTHSYESLITAPGCTQMGFTTHTCTLCGDSYTDAELPATGHRFVDGVCADCGETETAPISLSGTVISYGDPDAPVTVSLYLGEILVDTQQILTESFDVAGLEPGAYTVTFSKQGHMTRTYEVELLSETTTLSAKLCLVGDLNGDGRVNVGDVSRAYAHARGVSLVTEDYMLLCADVNGDGAVNVGDVAKLYGYLKYLFPLVSE